MLTSVVSAMARLGPAGRRAGARLDILRSTGLAYARRRLREEAALAASSPGRHVYARIWSEAAEEVGARVTELPGGFTQISRGGRVTRTHLNVTEMDGPVALRVALDKRLVHDLLSAAGIAVPEHVEVDFPDLDPAREFLARTGGPCVLKPARGTSGGDGATTGIRTEDDLVRAAVRGARTGSRLLMERQLTGDEHRLLFLDGRLIDVVRRRPPRLTGDGRATVAQLLADENRRRVNARGEDGLELVTLDLDAVLTLERLGLSLATVLAPGEVVTLKGLVSQAGRRDSERVDPETVDSDLVERARAAVEAIGLRFGGVDVIGDAVIEVNGTPGLHYHRHVTVPGPSSAVAVPVLSRLLA